MERRNFFTRLFTGSLAVFAVVPLAASAMQRNDAGKKTVLLKGEEIQHMVVFNLHHEKGSGPALKFLNDGRSILSNIKGVNNFQVFNQVSSKSDYSYGFSMVFASRGDYDAYSNHPGHISFVENRWKKEVSKFQEIDFKAL